MNDATAAQQELPSLNMETANLDPITYVASVCHYTGHATHKDPDGARSYLSGIPAHTCHEIYRYFSRHTTYVPNRGKANFSADCLWGASTPTNCYMLVLATAMSCIYKNIPYNIYMTDTHVMIGNSDGMATDPRHKQNEWCQHNPVQTPFMTLLASLPLNCQVPAAEWSIKIGEGWKHLDPWSYCHHADVYLDTLHEQITAITNAVVVTRNHNTILLPLIWMTQHESCREIAIEMIVTKLQNAYQTHLKDGMRIDAETTDILVECLGHDQYVMSLVRQLAPPSGAATRIPITSTLGKRTSRRGSQHLLPREPRYTTPLSPTINKDGTSYDNVASLIRSANGFRAVNTECDHITEHGAPCTAPNHEDYGASTDAIQRYLEESLDDSICIMITSTDQQVAHPLQFLAKRVKTAQPARIIMLIYDGYTYYGQLFDTRTMTTTCIGIEGVTSIHDGRSIHRRKQVDHLRFLCTDLGIDRSTYTHHETPVYTSPPYTYYAPTVHLGIFKDPGDRNGNVRKMVREHRERHTQQAMSGARLAVYAKWFANGKDLEFPSASTFISALNCHARSLLIRWRSERHQDSNTHWKIEWLLKTGERPARELQPSLGVLDTTTSATGRRWRSGVLQGAEAHAEPRQGATHNK